jgi:hypothetical protein
MPLKLKSFYVLPLIVLGLTTLIVRRDVLFYGRFFAEEGSIWFANSLSSNVVEQLTFVAPMTGYYTANVNLIILISSLIPLKFIPFFTTWISLFVQFLPAIFFLNLTSTRSSSFRLIGFLVLCLHPIFFEGETFANSINSQTYLAMCAIICVSFWREPIRLSLKYLHFVVL